MTRIRPESDKELSCRNHKRIVKVLDEHVLVFDPANDSISSASGRNASRSSFKSNFDKAKDYKYAFDSVFDEHTSQQEVYEHTTQSLIEFVLNGFNATVFAYGATGELFSASMCAY